MELFKTLTESIEIIVITESNITLKFKPYKITITKYNMQIVLIKEVYEIKIKEVSINYKNTNIDKIRFNFYMKKPNCYLLDFSFME